MRTASGAKNDIQPSIPLACVATAKSRSACISALSVASGDVLIADAHAHIEAMSAILDNTPATFQRRPRGPTYCALGRLSRFAARCSMAWAIQPLTLLIANVGVKSGT